MTEDAEQQARELPVPPNFPVEWESDEERRLLWRWDDIHSPLPSSPMSISISEVGTAPGSARAGEELGRTERRLRKRINGYSYSTPVPATPSPEQQEAAARAREEAIANTRRRWDTEFLPTIEKNLAFMRSVAPARADDSQLLEHLDQCLEVSSSHWYFHFLVVFPIGAATEKAASLYREIMGSVPDEEPYLLFQGIDNKSLETDRAIQALAKEAHSSAEVAKAFRRQASPKSLLDELAASDAGRGFLGNLDDFLSAYGYRPTGFDYVYPCWREDPSFVLLNVGSYLSSPPRDLDVEVETLRTESQRLLDRALERAQDDPAKRAEFLAAYQQARELWPLKEDHAFYIDQGTTSTIRMLIAEMGRRLARRGILESAGDVFYLTLEEVREAMSSASNDLATLAAGRRRERERFMKVIPPPFLGTLPPDGGDSMTPEFRRMMGPIVTAPPDGGSSVLRGVAGSKGAATGPARVVRSPDEFGKVQPGDMLVCTSTSPTWTALFGSLRGLVSDSGGVLSHTAIVAREYGLPAVVGVKFGTAAIRDGQVITVDGDNGVVHLR